MDEGNFHGLRQHYITRKQRALNHRAFLHTRTRTHTFVDTHTNCTRAQMSALTHTCLRSHTSSQGILSSCDGSSTGFVVNLSNCPFLSSLGLHVDFTLTLTLIKMFSFYLKLCWFQMKHNTFLLLKLLELICVILWWSCEPVTYKRNCIIIFF